MKKQLLQSLPLIAVLGMYACGSSNTETPATDSPAVVAPYQPADTVGAEGSASVSIDVDGTYKGILPCADCEGIETVLELKAADKSYTLTTKYLGKGDGKPGSVKGNWDWKTGNIIELQGESFGPDQYFVSEGKIIQLDMEGKRITGAMADRYELAKQ